MWGIILWKHALAALFFAVLVFCVAVGQARAADITSYSDTISDSAPSEPANHTVEFTTEVAIPTGGYVRFRPSPGDFTIPASTTLALRNVELYVDNVLRTTGTTTSTTTDGVAIVRGVNGNIEITLNSTTGIAADSVIRMKIGSDTTNATTTDTGVTNPAAIGTYPIYMETGGATGLPGTEAPGRVRRFGCGCGDLYDLLRRTGPGILRFCHGCDHANPDGHLFCRPLRE